MVGITIGSMAIVLLISIARGVQREVTDQVNDLGVNLLIVLPGRVEGMMFNPNLGGQSYLKPTDAEKALEVPGVRRAALLTFAGGGIKAGGKEAYPFIVAATPEWFQIRPVKLQSGRTYNASDGAEQVCVIGSIAKETLFGEQDAIGKTVDVNGHRYRIIGVTEDKKSEQSLFSMGSFENVVYIPYATLHRLEPNSRTDRIMLQTDPDREPKSLVSAVDTVLGQRLERQQYSVLTQEDLLRLIYNLMSILTTMVTGLTSIALFVGGVGIMTVMLMSVNERAREIGIRRTVGATRKDVFHQFLLEALMLAIAGGLIGLLLSIGVCWGLATFTKIKPLVTLGTVALSFGVSAGVGAVFGLLPALKAARQDPLVAIRNEH